jgi:hypothetical protein
MKRLLSLLLFLAAASGLAHATGGACPSGANYVNTANPNGSLVTLSSLGVTSCYYIDYTNSGGAASDSNAGTSESAPWLHAPSMANATGTPAAHTPGAEKAGYSRAARRLIFTLTR